MPTRKLRPITASGPREIGAQPLVEIPTPPPILHEVGRRKFEEVAAYLIDSGSLTAGEVPLVEQFAACYSRWVTAEELLATGDPGWRVVVTRAGTEGSAGPTAPMLQSKQSLDQLRRIGAALGLAQVERMFREAGWQ